MWYKFSKQMVLTKNSLSGTLENITNMLSALSRIDDRITVLMEEGHTQEVILDSALYSQIHGIILQNKGKTNELDQALSLLDEDLKFLKEKKKSDVISFFNP